MNPWNPQGNLQLVLEALRVLGASDSTRGCKELDLAKAERRIERALPTDLRQMYAGFSSAFLKKALGDNDIIRVADLKDVAVWDGGGLVDRTGLPAEWQAAEFMQFGSTCFGDELLYCLSDGPAGRGAIVVTDHEDDLRLKVLGDNLADWLARLAMFDGVELAVVPGSADDVTHDEALAFARDHLRLNPTSEWAARKVHAAESSSEDRILYLDERACRLRPIDEMTWLENATLRDVVQTSASPLARLTKLRHLLLSSCAFADLRPLAGLQNLEWLGIYDGPQVSVAPLAGLRKLNQLRTLRMDIDDVAALAPIGTLDFLEITQSGFCDVHAVARVGSLSKVSLPHTLVDDVEPLLKLARLEYLQIDGTRIRDIMPCVRMPKLKSLIVAKKQCSSETIKRFRSARPDVELSVW